MRLLGEEAGTSPRFAFAALVVAGPGAASAAGGGPVGASVQPAARQRSSAAVRSGGRRMGSPGPKGRGGYEPGSRPASYTDPIRMSAFRVAGAESPTPRRPQARPTRGV